MQQKVRRTVNSLLSDLSQKDSVLLKMVQNIRTSSHAAEGLLSVVREMLDQDFDFYLWHINLAIVHTSCYTAYSDGLPFDLFIFERQRRENEATIIEFIYAEYDPVGQKVWFIDKKRKTLEPYIVVNRYARLFKDSVVYCEEP